MPDVEQDALESLLWQHVHPVTPIRTDDNPWYTDIAWMGYEREFEIRDRGQFTKTVPIERV